FRAPRARGPKFLYRPLSRALTVGRLRAMSGRRELRRERALEGQTGRAKRARGVSRVTVVEIMVASRGEPLGCRPPQSTRGLEEGSHDERTPARAGIPRRVLCVPHRRRGRDVRGDVRADLVPGAGPIDGWIQPRVIDLRARTRDRLAERSSRGPGG